MAPDPANEAPAGSRNGRNHDETAPPSPGEGWFATENEEWVVRLQRWREGGGIGGRGAVATILHAAKLANLACASEFHRGGSNSSSTSSTTGSSIRALYLEAQNEMDGDGDLRYGSEARLSERPVSPPAVAATGATEAGDTSNKNNQEDDNNEDIAMELDAFFRDYPECHRSSDRGPGHWNEDDSDSYSDSDGGESCNERSEPSSPRHRRRRPNQDESSAVVDLVAAASEPLHTQTLPEIHARAESRTSSRSNHGSSNNGSNNNNVSNNNEQHTEPLDGDRDPHPRTDPDRPPQPRGRPLSANVNHSNTTDGASDACNAPNPKNPYRSGTVDLTAALPPGKERGKPRGPSDPNPYRRPVSRSGSGAPPRAHTAPRNPYDRRSQTQNPYGSGNASFSASGTNPAYGDAGNREAWLDHRNRTNPFQTAREVAQAEQNFPHRDPFRGDHRQTQNHRQPRHGDPGTRYGPSPSGNEDKGYGSYDADADAGHEGTGPYIPQSLKRKFQPPTRKGLGTGAGQPSQKADRPCIRSNSGGIGSRNRNASSSGGNRPKSEPADPSGGVGGKDDKDNDELPEALQHLEKELVRKIENEIMESGETVTFGDIAGLEDVKATVDELVCWPMKRPDLFTGLRKAPNGLLLYGPPGTGKTLIGKAIAHESGATFFSISSSSLTSKWIGEGEKLVRTLFAVAAYHQPAVVFIDEIDSLLTQRTSSENEASRRIKTEFLVQLDGTGTTGQGRVLAIGATNRPQELDEAARRRFTKRLYVPLPEEADRRVLLEVLLKTNKHELGPSDVVALARDTKGFSGADLRSLCTDAAMGPIRQLGSRAMEISLDAVPPISYKHFQKSLRGTRPSVAQSDLKQYVEWDKTYGTKRYIEDEDEDD